MEVTDSFFREPTSDAQNVDLKRQLDSVEQEASVLRTKVFSLEQDNEKMANENKKLALHAARLSRKDSIGDKDKNVELVKLKDSVTKLEKTKEELENKLKLILDAPADKLPQRVPKIFSENSTKLQLQVRCVCFIKYLIWKVCRLCKVKSKFNWNLCDLDISPVVTTIW